MRQGKETRVERLANEYMAWFRRWGQRLSRWPRTYDQVEGTASSIVANLGEAMDSETMAQKRKYFGYAKASAGEGLRLVSAATHAGMLPAEAGAEGLRLLRDIRWDVVRLIRWTRQ